MQEEEAKGERVSEEAVGAWPAALVFGMVSCDEPLAKFNLTGFALQCMWCFGIMVSVGYGHSDEYHAAMALRLGLA